MRSWKTLSPRYTIKGSSPTNGWQSLTACANPFGLVCAMRSDGRIETVYDQADFARAHFCQRIDGVLEQGLVSNRDQGLGHCQGDRIQPCAFACTQDYRFHTFATCFLVQCVLCCEGWSQLTADASAARGEPQTGGWDTKSDSRLTFPGCFALCYNFR